MVGVSSGSGQYTLSLDEATPEIIEIGDSRSGDINQTGLLAFAGETGQIVDIALESDDFDTTLTLYGPNGQQIAYNDDGGNGTNSLIGGVFLTDERYTLIPGSLDGSDGEYTLRISSITPESLELGETQTGDISDGTIWLFAGEAGQSIEISLSSDDFDTVLSLTGPDGTEVGFSDDYDGSNSFISVSLPEDGTYVINVRAYSGGSGDYTLTLGAG